MKIQKSISPIITATFLLCACSSADKKTETAQPAPVVAAVEPAREEPAAPQVQSRSVDTGSSLDAANERLAKVAMLGLPAYDASLAGDSGKAALDTVKSVTENLPEGHVLQITGHANKHPDKTKRTSNALSVQRAKAVHDYFVKNGVAKEKLTYRGVGSSEYDEKLSRDANRRVTFRLVKKE